MAAALILAAAAFAADSGVSISDVVDHPLNFAGKTVTVAGRVDEVIGPASFTLRSGGILGIGGNKILVLGRGGVPLDLGDKGKLEEMKVGVTGPVRIFNRIEFERDLFLDLDDKLFTVYEGRPAVVVQKLALLPRNGEERLGAASGGRSDSSSAGTSGPVRDKGKGGSGDRAVDSPSGDSAK